MNNKTYGASHPPLTTPELKPENELVDICHVCEFSETGPHNLWVSYTDGDYAMLVCPNCGDESRAYKNDVKRKPQEPAGG